MSHSQALTPLGPWSVLTRGRFEARHGDHIWTVDVDFLDFGERVRLYRDGALVEERRSPATFDLGDGARIDASMDLLGMRRIDLVTPDRTRTLTPVEGTAEAWRLGVERERPTLSRSLGAASWMVLVVALVIELRQLARLAGLDFEPTLALPGVAGVLLGLAALAAALERALRFKSNRWLG